MSKPKISTVLKSIAILGLFSFSALQWLGPRFDLASVSLSDEDLQALAQPQPESFDDVQHDSSTAFEDIVPNNHPETLSATSTQQPVLASNSADKPVKAVKSAMTYQVAPDPNIMFEIYKLMQNAYNKDAEKAWAEERYRTRIARERAIQSESDLKVKQNELKRAEIDAKLNVISSGSDVPVIADSTTENETQSVEFPEVRVLSYSPANSYRNASVSLKIGGKVYDNVKAQSYAGPLIVTGLIDADQCVKLMFKKQQQTRCV